MTAPKRGQVWRHLTSGWHFEVEHDCSDHGHHGWTQLRRIDTQCAYLVPSRALGSWFELVTPSLSAPGGADEVMALAEAVGIVAEQVREPGQQPASEFASGPVGPGAWWDDENLADVFGLRGGGAR